MQGLVNLHQVHEIHPQYPSCAELFMTHPTLTHRVMAIAKNAQIPAKNLGRILGRAGIAETR
jgi:hypothetical protein